MKDFSGTKWADVPRAGIFGPVRNDDISDDTEFRPTPSSFVAQEPEQPEEAPNDEGV